MLSVTSSANIFYSYDECFDEAITFLEDLESDLGFMVSVDDATVILNDAYAACYCLNTSDVCGNMQNE
ncbi:MAG: hypothetical protein CL613_03005 [Aquimarina sp.]|nr:hypothetical protein [Aquimarina sp.]